MYVELSGLKRAQLVCNFTLAGKCRGKQAPFVEIMAMMAAPLAVLLACTGHVFFFFSLSLSLFFFFFSKQPGEEEERNETKNENRSMVTKAGNDLCGGAGHRYCSPGERGWIDFWSWLIERDCARA